MIKGCASSHVATFLVCLFSCMLSLMTTSALAETSITPLDPKVASSTAIPCGEKYTGAPPTLEIKDPSNYIQPWSGYRPQTTLKNGAADNLPCMTANIKYNDYKGIEVQGNKWIALACDLATQSVRSGLDPFGSVLLQIDDETGEVIRYWQSVNRVNDLKDPTAHAEILAIRAACKDLQVSSLGTIRRDQSKLPQTGKTSHCELYTSHESCSMCYSAMRQTSVSALYFACTVYDGEVQGLNYHTGRLYHELATPIKDRPQFGMHVYQCTVPNSLDALNLYKLTEH
jgi:guanine deaminase